MRRAATSGGLVTRVETGRDEAAVRFGNYTATVTAADMGSSKRSPRSEFKPGYLVEFQIKEVDKKNKRLKVEMQPVPSVEGSLITLNAKTGEIIAMQGGYDFLTNKFNNAVQAYRQTGSAFKPFIYKRRNRMGHDAGHGRQWRTHQHRRLAATQLQRLTSNGDMPLKTALAQSMNIPAVHLLQTVGIQTGAQMVRRFGYQGADGSLSSVRLWVRPKCHSIKWSLPTPPFPNKGIRVEPHMMRRVLDRDGACWTSGKRRLTKYSVNTCA
jgi:penicillin-binding protein 1A